MKAILSLLILTCAFKYGYAQQNTADSMLLEYYQNQRFTEAADYLKKTNPEPVNDMKILSSLAYASQMAGRLPDAEQYYQRIYARDSTNMAVLFHLGNIEGRRGDNAKALVYFKKILQRDSTNFSVYKQMAGLAQNMGDIPTGVSYLQKANRVNPADGDVAYNLANLYLGFKLYLKADTIATIALQADTANLLLLFAKAQAIYHLKKYPETAAICNKLMQSGDRTTMVINMLGSSYYNLKSYANCINTFKLMEESKTASETSYYYTAMSYKALSNQSMAVEYFDKAIKEAVSPNVNSYYSEMADSYDSLHQLNKAVNAYQKSLLYGVLPLTYYELANIYDAQLKNKAAAVRYFKKYIASNPPRDQRAYVNYSKKRVSELNR